MFRKFKDGLKSRGRYRFMRYILLTVINFAHLTFDILMQKLDTSSHLKYVCDGMVLMSFVNY